MVLVLAPHRSMPVFYLAHEIGLNVPGYRLGRCSQKTSGSSQGTPGTRVSLSSVRHLLTHLKVVEVALTHPERDSKLEIASGVHPAISCEYV